MIKAGVVGAAGYIGGELLRILTGHPEVDVIAATSARRSGRRVDVEHPNLRGHTDLSYVAPAGLPRCDVLFFATSSLDDLKLRADLCTRADVVYDLSPDLRLTDPDRYALHYGRAHPAPELLGTPVPGWPELHREALRSANLVSVPGCMATAATLALLPLAAESLIEPTVTVDGRAGSSGAGASAGEQNIHAERAGVLRVFAPLEHRHQAEISAATGLDVRMSATGVAAVRGVQVLCRATARGGVSPAQVRAAYRQCYRDEPFVRVVAARRGGYRYPEPKLLYGTNYCDVGFAMAQDTREVLAIGALDNLVKGGAGNAVQCLNIRMGWAEHTGLSFPGLHPI
jgi:N-acetyl-gamma-glutamyl-phosphate/LysW-gamma-L-alpha-aminoadipyl-6-phosphate reductase